MKLLVAIPFHGTKNRPFLDKMLSEFRSMSYHVDVVILTEKPKELPSDVEVWVGSPTKDPWSLPFGHRRLFVERQNDYDLFIYAEDDTLIKACHVESYLSITRYLPSHLISGFLRYEEDSSGNTYCSSAHSRYRWVQGSTATYGPYTVARFTNDHSAFYMLTREQLSRAIRSGGFDVPPHKGRYDMLCSAATDPYTQCGFTKVIPISHLDDFLVHHMPGVYIGQLGIGIDALKEQVESLLAMNHEAPGRNLHDEAGQQLFATEKKLPVGIFDKFYYESRDPHLERLIPDQASRILAIGAGLGSFEASILDGRKGPHAVVPLDDVVGHHYQLRGIEATPANFAHAFDDLSGKSFDVIVLKNVLQHVEDPVSLLMCAQRLLAVNGIIVGSVLNLGPHVIRYPRLVWRAGFQSTLLHPTSPSRVQRWARAAGLRSDLRFVVSSEKRRRVARLALGLAQRALANAVVFSMRP